jgi:ketosteroid isomerase-like protein
VSRENVEVVRRVMDAEARREEAAIFALYDEDIVWDVSEAGGPVAGVVGALRGHAGVRSWLRTWYEGFENVTYEVEELLDAGEHVLAVITMRGRGRTSGADVLTRLYGAWTMRDGKVVRVAWFDSREKALEAVGLRE